MIGNKEKNKIKIEELKWLSNRNKKRVRRAKDCARTRIERIDY